MIDYVKISILNINIPQLLTSNYLEFKTEVSEKTGELSTKKVAEYHYCKITIFDSRVVLFTGSIHKLWNSLNGIKAPNHKSMKPYKGFNGNQFTLDEILKVKEHLEKLLKCPPQQMIFQNIEFGINTTLNFNPQLYLKGLLYHKGKQFEYKYNDHFAQAKHQRYFLKIYNKSSQYLMPQHTLRVELKVIKTEDIKHIGITTFEDINSTTLNKAMTSILKRFDEVVHYDYTIQKDSLTERTIRYLKNYSNPRYWIHELKPQHRDRHKKRLIKITYKNSLKIHQKIRENLVQKCVIINRLSENTNCVIINRSSIGLNITHIHPKITTKKKVIY